MEAIRRNFSEEVAAAAQDKVSRSDRRNETEEKKKTEGFLCLKTELSCLIRLLRVKL